jgi:type II secretory pathway pseudopilin PulG
MVVIGIIVLLATFLLPMANRAYVAARRAALASDLQMITTAIDAYQHDFGDIPRPDKHTANPFQGGVILTWALLSPGPAVMNPPTANFSGDGADGIGFRVRGQTGTILGPYLPDGHFRFGIQADMSVNPVSPLTIVPPTNAIYDDSATFLADRYGNAILYFPHKPKVIITSLSTYFGLLASKPAFVANDNDPGLAVQGPGHPFASITAGNTWAVQQFQLQLPGIIPDSGGLPTLPDPNQATKLPYLLWDSGPDGRFCTEDDVSNFKN